MLRKFVSSVVSSRGAILVAGGSGGGLGCVYVIHRSKMTRAQREKERDKQEAAQAAKKAQKEADAKKSAEVDRIQQLKRNLPGAANKAKEMRMPKPAATPPSTTPAATPPSTTPAATPPSTTPAATPPSTTPAATPPSTTPAPTPPSTPTP